MNKLNTLRDEKADELYEQLSNGEKDSHPSMSVERNKYKYLIERKDTNEWYCINITGYYGTTYEGETFGEIPDKKNDWTNNANDALQFNSRQEAELFIKGQEYLHDVLHFDCEITEHEFISENANPSPSPITQTTTSMSAEQGLCRWIKASERLPGIGKVVLVKYFDIYQELYYKNKVWFVKGTNLVAYSECFSLQLEWLETLSTAPTVKADGRKPYNEDGTCKKCGGNQCDSDSHK